MWFPHEDVRAYVAAGTSGGTRWVTVIRTAGEDSDTERPPPVTVAVALSVAFPGDPAVFQQVEVPTVRWPLSANGVQCGAFVPVRPMVPEVMATGNVTCTVTGLTVPSLMAA